MNTHADKTQENKSRSAANALPHKQIVRGFPFHFVDNRPEALAQRKLQDIVNSSAQTKYVAKSQSVANSERPEFYWAEARHVVQRSVLIGIDEDNIICTGVDAERPPGCLPGGSQGDHTTPFTSLQGQIANAIEGVTLDNAWVNLADTLVVYTSLPGWAQSTKYTRETYYNYVNDLIQSRGNIEKLRLAANRLLALRNQIALTSLPNGGHGNAEGTWAGTLQYQERQFQLGYQPVLDRNQILDYIWKAFDHGRVNALGEEKRNQIIRQHAITMADAYPQLNASTNINPNEIVAHYNTRDWQNYNPS